MPWRNFCVKPRDATSPGNSRHSLLNACGLPKTIFMSHFGKEKKKQKQQVYFSLRCHHENYTDSSQ
jgi:hypothetical protein